MWLSSTTGQFVKRRGPNSSDIEHVLVKAAVADEPYLHAIRNGVEKILAPHRQGIIQTQLSSINLSFCSKVANDSVKNIANHCPCLSEAYFRGCYLVTDNGMMYLSEKCPWLRILDIAGGSAFGPSRITDESILTISKRSLNLKILNADNVHGLTLGGISELLKRCRHVNQISVSCGKNIVLVDLVRMVKDIRSVFTIPSHVTDALQKGKAYKSHVTIYVRPLRP